MKTFYFLIVAAVLSGSMISVSYGDQLTMDEYIGLNADLETLQINDATGDTNEGAPNPLFRIFNEYFHDEIVTLGESNYTSGNELVEDRMIRQTISSWHVNPGSNVVASFTSSAWTHGLEIYSTTGNLLFDTDQYVSTTTAEAIIDGQAINLEGGDYVFSVNSGGLSKAFSGDHEWYYSSDEYLNGGSWTQYYEDGINHLLAFNVTDLMRQRFGYEGIESAFLFAFEDLNISDSSDFDYQDFAFILTNVNANTVTPEPSTALILSFAGVLALSFLRRKNKKAKKIVDRES
ncbi:MAG: PEP-CTERM sorting domain-containing protein [Planctomycetaceae bacterium]|jgi:hypothetical protein|nr:PEP-CTERM sorting domain-containing protein [Planctomycetaceae bacterium]